MYSKSVEKIFEKDKENSKCEKDKIQEKKKVKM